MLNEINIDRINLQNNREIIIGSINTTIVTLIVSNVNSGFGGR